MVDRMDTSFDNYVYYIWQVWKGSVGTLDSSVHETLSVLLMADDTVTSSLEENPRAK